MTERDLIGKLQRKFGNATVSSGGNGTEVVVDCPWCNRHKLSVNTAKLVWHCWHCGEAGTVRKLLGTDVRIDNRPARAARPMRFGLVPPGDTVPLCDLPDDNEAVLYLRSRRFDPAEASASYALSYCRSGRKFGGGVFDTTGCLIIPIVENGREIAWQARILYNVDDVAPGQEAAYGWLLEDGKYKKPPKYFTAPGFQKGRHLFNIDAARTFPMVVVTEGVFDAMRVGPCAVASFGKGVTDDQAAILRDSWRLVVLLLDPDAEADQEALAARLRGSGPFGGGSLCRVVSVHLEGYKDAGEAPKAEVARQILAACAENGVDLGRLCRDDPFKPMTK